MSMRVYVGLLAISLGAAACGGSDHHGPQSYSLGVSVTGLSGTGLVLQNNGGNDLAVPANGTLTFSSVVVSGGAYNVTVKTQPVSPWQTCAVGAGSGTMGSVNITNIAVTCTTNQYAVGGTVSGLKGSGLMLQNGAGNDLAVAGNGAFVFPTRVLSGGTYGITVKTQPEAPRQKCEVTGGQGTLAGADVSGASVTCTQLVGRFLYSNSETNIYGYTIDAQTGALTAMSGSPFAVGYRANAMDVDAWSRAAYIVNVTTNDMRAYTIDQNTGALAYISAPIASTSGPGVVAAVHQSGKFAYVGSFGTSSVAMYSIDPVTRALTSLTPPHIESIGWMVSDIVIDPTGRFAFVSNAWTDDVSVFSVDASTGLLSYAPGSPFAGAGDYPGSIALTPDGKFLYTANYVSRNISVFSVDTATGAVTPTAGSPINSPGMPREIVVHPSGRFAVVTDDTRHSFDVYSLDPRTGALTPVAGSPFQTGESTTAVAIEPSGKFIYIGVGSLKRIYAYAFDEATGTLTAVPGSPYFVDFNPGAFVAAD